MTTTVEPTTSATAVPAVGRGAVAVITRSPQGGGVAYIARLLSAALADESNREPPVLSLEQEHAGRVHPLRKLSFSSRLVAHNALHRSDWIIFGHAGIASAQMLVPRVARLPYAVQLHGTDAWERAPSMAVRNATLRIAPSQYTIDRARRAFPEIGDVALCAHGLLPDGATSGSPDETLLSQLWQNSALILGRVLASERRKGHDQLLECWPRVLETVPDAQLVIAGDGDDLDRLRAKARSVGIGKSVLFCGYVSDATRKALLERVAMFAMPSQQEGFGLVYLEAMRAALPCIGALDDGATEPVVHGETGFLVRQSDRDALAHALVSMFRDVNLRRRLGAAGHRRFVQRYTFEAYRKRLRELLASSFDASRAPRGDVPGGS
jgi:phosphatidyl-myo-inositol dimannoside synthase